ncbi:unnamed protein product, partial [Didymodactylos carnosus]
MQEDRQ